MTCKMLTRGGSRSQSPLVPCARARGLSVRTCHQYLPGSPGLKLANECHGVSTTGHEDLMDTAGLRRHAKVSVHAGSDATRRLASAVFQHTARRDHLVGRVEANQPHEVVQ